jgi:outer membrane protein assembly factor BamE (lipoprotein component of BamABCDE complex)
MQEQPRPKGRGSIKNSLQDRLVRTFFKFCGALACIASMAACGNLSRNIAADGSYAGQLVWPAPSTVIQLHKGGTFPEVSDLRLVRAGMNKQQIMQLLGPPHFSEGVLGVREWNYLFNFRMPGSDQPTQCQYKVLFDENKLARSFYWMPASCASVLDEAKPDVSAGTK